MVETTCAECGQEHSSMRGLSFHVKVHGLNSESYAEKYMGQTSLCECGSKKTFRGITLGFSVKCEACLRSESAVESKKRLKENTEAFDQFRKRTAEGMVKVWADRAEQGITVFDIVPGFMYQNIGDVESAPLEEHIEKNLTETFGM